MLGGRKNGMQDLVLMMMRMMMMMMMQDALDDDKEAQGWIRSNKHRQVDEASLADTPRVQSLPCRVPSKWPSKGRLEFEVAIQETNLLLCQTNDPRPSLIRLRMP